MRPSTMQVRVVSFGPLRSALPEGGQTVELTCGETVAGLLQRLRETEQISEKVLLTSAIAVNHEYALPDASLNDGDEVAILPPVSGGSTPLVKLVREPIDAESIVQQMKAGEDGAVVIFDGIVRDNTRGRKTLYLDYEAYEDMAVREMAKLRTQAIERFAVRDVAIVHRLGRLVVGETSVLIVVASAHRGAAFDACRWVIDTLKQTVPIWKREQFEDGTLWAAGEPFPAEIAGAPR